MHIFCSYGKWEDIAALTFGGILIQEKRCEICNRVKRRQTNFLGGSFSKPILGRGLQTIQSDETDGSAPMNIPPAPKK